MWKARDVFPLFLCVWMCLVGSVFAATPATEDRPTPRSSPNAAPAKVTPGQVAPGSTGAAKVAPTSTGAVKVAPTSTGAAKVAPTLSPSKAATNAAATSTTGTPTRHLSLADALQLLLKQNPALASERLTIRQADADLNAARGVFRFDLNLNLKLDRSALPLDVQVDSSLLGVVNGDFALGSWSIEGNVQLSKRFSPGTILSASFVQWWSLQDTPNFQDLLAGKQDVATFQTHRSSTTFQLQIVQPLLRGAWLAVNMAPIYQAAERAKVVRLQVAMTVMNYVSQAAIAYWDLVYARREMEIKEGALRLAETQLSNTMALIKAGKLAPLERFQVMQVVAARQGDVLLAKDLITKAETQLAILLQVKDGANLLPTAKADLAPTKDTKEELLKWARANHPQIAIAKRQIEIARYSVVTSRNDVLPQLDLTANFAFVGSGRTQVTKGQTSTPGISPIGRAYETLFDPRFHRFFVGISLKVPLDNRQATEKLVRHNIEVQRTLLELNRQYHQIRLDIQQQYTQLLRIQKRLAIAKVSRLWAEKKLEAEQSKYDLGKSTLFNVLTFQQDLADARLTALRAVIDYRKAIITLDLKVGRLLQRYNIVQKR